MTPNLHRLTTVPLSFATLLKGQPRFMQQYYEVTIICSDKERLEKVGIAEDVTIYFIAIEKKKYIIFDYDRNLCTFAVKKKMIPREVSKLLSNDLNKRKALILLGARQVGKTSFIRICCC
jgi:hypothetical protein